MAAGRDKYSGPSMKRGTQVGVAALLAALVAGAALWLSLRSGGPRARGPMAHQAYVWQRAWTPEVRRAIGGHADELAGLVALGAEISWSAGRPVLVRVAIDHELLKSLRGPVGLALRVGGYSGPFTPDAEATKAVLSAARGLLDQSRAAGLTLSELQIDFDCPESKLDGYRAWVELLRRQAAPTPVVVTALPSWLDRPAARALLEAADGYVLQVHSLVRPAGPDAMTPLCDPAAAVKAVEKAARLGRPFRVALPTYGYVAAFDSAGKFLGISAEGPAPNWPADARRAEIHSDPAALAALVRQWTADRPACMTGIIWYRLPNDEDKMNWRWATIKEVMAGRTPVADLRVRAERPETRLREIVLENAGTADAPLDVTVTVRWDKARLVAADAIGGFERVEPSPPGTTDGKTGLVLKGQAPEGRLRPGEKKRIGWLRLSEDKEVVAHVQRSGP